MIWLLCIGLALIADLLTWPGVPIGWQPSLSLLLLLALAIYLPARRWFWLGVLTGLVLDVVRGGHLGELMLPNLLLLALALDQSRLLSNLPWPQQTLLIAGLLLAHLALGFWLRVLTGEPVPAALWFPQLGGALMVWTALHAGAWFLRRWRRHRLAADPEN